MKQYNRLLFTTASVILTGAFGFLQAQNGTPEKLHQRVYEHYDPKEIALFKSFDIEELNWYMTQSFVIDKTTTVCASCGELNVDTFDVIRYDNLRTDEGRVRVILPRMKYPLFLFSKNEVLDKIHSLNKNTPPVHTTDTTIFTCSGTIYDPGGPSGNYTVGMDTVITYCSGTPGSCISVNFTTWGMSDAFCTQHDVLIIYDGPDTSSAWVGDYSTTANIPTNAPTTITSTTGCLTFKLKVDACSPGDIGWAANISCAPCVLPPPQPSCNNVDFETGDFTGWTGTEGTNYATTWANGIVAGRQTIQTGIGTDACGGFPVVAPGGSFSAQLGNNINGAFSEQLFQRFAVTAANANFTLQYAVVMENPGHAFFDQPFFRIEVYNDSNNIVQCGYYYVAAGSNVPGFQLGACNVNSASYYKPWSYIAINLVPYIGQSVTVKYTTADCSRTGHFGYAYLDCTCNPFLLGGPTGICPGQQACLIGPNGFANYSWSWSGGPLSPGDTLQNLCVTDSGTYCVTVSTSNQACASSTICGHLDIFAQPVADFSYSPASPMLFSQMPVCFSNLSTISLGTIASYNWNFGDSSIVTDISTATNPCYTYIEKNCNLFDSSTIIQPGDSSYIKDICQHLFCVNLTATSDNGCTASAQKCFEIFPDSLIIPNVFTPNGDSKNEYFHFPNIGYKDLHCDIYNRWGAHVYSWDGITGGWNGETKVGPASDGTYYWVMTATKLDNTTNANTKPVTDHGWVQLMRH